MKIKNVIPLKQNTKNILDNLSSRQHIKKSINKKRKIPLELRGQAWVKV